MSVFQIEISLFDLNYRHFIRNRDNYNWNTYIYNLNTDVSSILIWNRDISIYNENNSQGLPQCTQVHLFIYLLEREGVGVGKEREVRFFEFCVLLNGWNSTHLNMIFHPALSHEGDAVYKDR